MATLAGTVQGSQTPGGNPFKVQWGEKIKELAGLGSAISVPVGGGR